AKLGTALKNDFKAIGYLAKYRGIPREVFPKPPPILEKPKAVLPTPEQIHQLLHGRYVPDPEHSYEQHLIEALLRFDFGFGPRMPSEAYALKLQFLDIERHLLIIQEPKKSNRQRRLVIKPKWLCCSPTRGSLANYVRHWRPKVDVGGTDAFFLDPNGEPFKSKDALTQWLNGRVKDKFPWYYPYLGRHWCANARLIDSRDERGSMDFVKVAEWLGHTSVTTLRRYYEHDAEMHYELYGGNWIERAFHGRGKRQRTSKTP
ncbi:MAG: site-specific integrase, partial [Euryarchaeota archaeon]|nr:site-specific integrase [Euryarchaeota archaeon]